MGIAKGIDLSKLVDYTAIEDGPWWRVGFGDSRFGQVGQQIGVVSLKHASGYAIVMQMQSGKIEAFRHMQLFPYESQVRSSLMFFDLPSDKTCIHPEHDPPTGLYIPPGKGYRHVCPACKTFKDVIPPQYSLTQRAQAPRAWKVTEEMHRAAVKVLQRANGIDGLPQRMLDAMIAAAPLAPTHLTDGEIIAAQEALIAAKDALYSSRIGLQCSRCKKGTYRADGNGYYDFHRCDSCRHVPMWGSDGKEFGMQEKRNGPSI